MGVAWGSNAEGQCNVPVPPPGVRYVAVAARRYESLALRSDGSEAFGLYISPKPNFEPVRSDRKERGEIDGRQIYWYRAEIAAAPGIEARETLLALPDGRAVHIWLQAPSREQLDAGFQLTQSLHFAPGNDKQVASGQ